MNIWVIAVIGGLFAMVLGFVLMVFLGRKTNIEYVICQTFLKGEKWYRAIGLVDVKNDGSFMAEYIMKVRGKKKEIGTFHQKHLKPTTNNKYIILLEEWDRGRFRPMEREQNFSGELTIKPVPNHDIDWILQRKEKNRILEHKKEERGKWIPALVSAGLLIIVAVFMALVSYWMVEMSANFKDASAEFNKGAHKDVKDMKQLLENSTVQIDIKGGQKDILPNEIQSGS